jgi:hypothetical protein
LQLDFGEQGQEKRVILLDVHAGKPALPQSIALSSGRRLRDIAGSLEELEAAAHNLGNDYLRVTVKAAGPVPGIADRIREILPNALDVRTDFPRAGPQVQERQHMAPDAMFQAFYESQHGAPPAKELMQAFRSLYEEMIDAPN